MIIILRSHIPCSAHHRCFSTRVHPACHVCVAWLAGTVVRGCMHCVQATVEVVATLPLLHARLDAPSTSAMHPILASESSTLVQNEKEGRGQARAPRGPGRTHAGQAAVQDQPAATVAYAYKGQVLQWILLLTNAGVLCLLIYVDSRRCVLTSDNRDGDSYKQRRSSTSAMNKMRSSKLTWASSW